MRAAWTILLAMAVGCGSAWAEKQPQVQLEDCSENAAATQAILRTQVVTSPNGMVRMYGELESVADGAFAATQHCHVVYRLWVGRKGQTYRLAFEKPWEVEDGEIAGIDVVGFSPNGAKAAANFWLAKGDWTEDRPVVADLLTRQAALRSVGEEILNRVKRDCDASYWQRVDAVTNAGAVLISVPAYEDCPAAGSWSFSPSSGRLMRLSAAAVLPRVAAKSGARMRGRTVHRRRRIRGLRARRRHVPRTGSAAKGRVQ